MGEITRYSRISLPKMDPKYFPHWQYHRSMSRSSIKFLPTTCNLLHPLSIHAFCLLDLCITSFGKITWRVEPFQAEGTTPPSTTLLSPGSEQHSKFVLPPGQAYLLRPLQKCQSIPFYSYLLHFEVSTALHVAAICPSNLAQPPPQRASKPSIF